MIEKETKDGETTITKYTKEEAQTKMLLDYKDSRVWARTILTAIIVVCITMITWKVVCSGGACS